MDLKKGNVDKCGNLTNKALRETGSFHRSFLRSLAMSYSQ